MTIDVQFRETALALDIAFDDRVCMAGDMFDGDYILTPRADPQTVPTKNKILLEDMVVDAIPYAEVTNLSNGKTVTIG